MSGFGEVSNEIGEACRSIDGYEGAKVIGEVLWVPKNKKWAFPIQIELPTYNNTLIPNPSAWFVVVDDRYPWGEVEIFPSKNGGIESTFPHQHYNSVGGEDVPWRTGKMCVQSPAFALRRIGDDSDPKGQVERLRWYIDRAKEWIAKAAENQLITPGDNFELPHWDAGSETVGFLEDPQSFKLWATRNEMFGLAEFAVLVNDFPLAVRRFLTCGGKEIYVPQWGKRIREVKRLTQGLWVRVRSVPVLQPYAAPMNWNELFVLFAQSGIDADIVIKRCVENLRDNKEHVFLIGFPVPRSVGEPASLMHWQPLRVEPLSTRLKPSKGFRSVPEGLWLADKIRVFGAKKSLEWLSGRNWSGNEVGTRGRHEQVLRDKKLLLIGCGALGSNIGELLVRGGVNDLTVLDKETTNAGNLVRHTLGVSNIGEGKARGLARHLNEISPHASVEFIGAEYGALTEIDERRIRDIELIIDCTGADDVVATLSKEQRPVPVEFVSLSIGRGAKRLYFFAARDKSFPVQEFWDALSPWLATDRKEFSDLTFPWEGTGCWHPVFPASCVPITKAAAIAVRTVETWLASSKETTSFKVIEVADDGVSADTDNDERVFTTA